MTSGMTAEEKLVSHLEQTYLGRVPLPSGFAKRAGAVVNVYPIVITTKDGRALGIIAIAADDGFVQLYRIGAFVQGRG